MDARNVSLSHSAPLLSGKAAASTAPISLGLEEIRKIRQGFEQEVAQLKPALGNQEHQSMLVAMYEGTEVLLNRTVPEFAVVEYLEELKLTAQDLQQRGFHGGEYQQRLLEQSRHSLEGMLARI